MSKKDHAWWLFLDQIDEAKELLGFKDNEEVFYRGHTHLNHNLVPGLFRQTSQNFSAEELWPNESDLFYEFRSRALAVHGSNITDWDVLFFMQHHGVRTRLLDWTENFGVALYFALLNYTEDKSPCIWIMNPYKLNKVYDGTNDFYAPENLDIWNKDTDEWESYSQFLLHDSAKDILNWKVPLAIYPTRKVDRLVSQGGYFTIHGTDIRPIEHIIPEQKLIWKKLVLSKEAVAGATAFLELAGINDFSMFPDLDGLARFLNKKYFFDPRTERY